MALSAIGATAVAGCQGLGDTGSPDTETQAGTDRSGENPPQPGATLVFQEKLLAGDGGENDAFGDSVALSADSSTTLVGVTNRNEYAGEVYVFERTGDGWTEQATLVDDDSAPVDRFGSAVALSADGTVAVVGARLDVNPNGVARAFSSGRWGSGSVFLFERDGASWAQQAKLWASDGVGGDVFGGSVALSADGTVLLVGSPHSSSGTDMGAAYVFERDGWGWQERSKLVKSNRSSFEHFGDSVALSADGTVALVGAHGAVQNGELAGGVYVFEREGSEWVRRTELVSEDISIADRFGEQVALSRDGTRAVIAAPGDNSAYVFEQAGGSWRQETKLPPEFGRVSDVALSGEGDIAAVGNPRARDEDDEQTGVVPLFERVEEEWVQRTRLLAEDRERDDGFGTPLAVSDNGTTLVSLARGDDNENGENAGAAYVYGQ